MSRSAQATTRVAPDRNDQKYFTITPHLVWVVSRDPYDYMFWSVIKMVAGDNGECTLSAQDLAKACGMGINKVVDCRTYLIAQGLLTGELTDEGGQRPRATWHLRIPDLWPQNVAWRAAVGDGLRDRIEARRAYHDGGTPPSPREGFPSPREGFPSPREGFPSPREGSQAELHHIENQEEKPRRKTNKKNDDDAQRARGNGSSSSFQTWDDLIGFYGQAEVTEAVRVADGKGKAADFRYVCGILRIRAQRGAAPAARRGNGRRDPYAWEPVREVVTSMDDWEMVGEE
jgi:hypothetical protein